MLGGREGEGERVECWLVSKMACVFVSVAERLGLEANGWMEALVYDRHITLTAHADKTHT
jgi:hypothetical protein